MGRRSPTPPSTPNGADTYNIEIFWNPFVAFGLSLFGRVPLRLLQDGLLFSGRLLVILLDRLRDLPPQFRGFELALDFKN